MKTLFWLFSLCVLAAGLLFYTPYAAEALKPYVKKVIEKRLDVEITVTQLKLHVNSFELQIVMTPQNSIDIHGSYSPFSNTLDAAYTATLNELSSLKTLIGHELVGQAVITGNIAYSDNNLNVTADSALCDGTIKARYSDKILRTDFSDLQTMKLLKMLQYPQIIRASLHGKMTFHNETQTGDLLAQINEAYLAQNRTMNLLKEVSEFNIYDAKFSGALNAQINDNIINSTLQLQAPDATITTPSLTIDTKKNIIDTKLHVIANSYPFDINISGNIKEPQVKLDTKEVIKNELGRYLNRLLKELF